MSCRDDSENGNDCSKGDIMFYHASTVKGIVQIAPRASNHGVPLIYCSRKGENVLV